VTVREPRGAVVIIIVCVVLPAFSGIMRDRPPQLLRFARGSCSRLKVATSRCETLTKSKIAPWTQTCTITP
jgi:hypothetical protein